MIPVVQVRDVPSEVRDLAGPHDYVDLFVATVPAGGVTPEQLARATIGSASAAGRILAWRVVCGLRRDKQPSRDQIEGWRIAGRGDDWLLLADSGPYLSAQMLFQVEPDRLSFATFVHYDKAIGRAVWAAAQIVHRAVAPDFLRGGVRQVRETAA